MKKSILIIGVIFLFILSALAPMSTGYNFKTSDEIEPKSTSSDDGGLMNSSWPMFQHDVRHTGRSLYGDSGNWFVEKWNKGIGSMVFSSPAIDKNGTIYIGSNDWHLYAINSDGTEKWRYKTGGGVSSSPAIGEDGTIYVGSEDAKFYAFYPNGTRKWSLTIGDGWVRSSPVIDEDGVIYITSVAGNNICAVYPNGTKKWDFKTDGDVYSSPVLDDMGIVYCGSHDGYMYAIYTINGTLKWKHGTGTYCGGAGATIGYDGTIYFGDLLGYLHAVNPNGTQKWKKDLGDNIYCSPTITEEGNIIIGCYDSYIYNFDPDNGDENWRFSVGDWVSGSPIIDKYGIIYVGTWNGIFYALNPNGTLRWKYKTLDTILPSAAIDENGTIYFGAHSDTFTAKLYAIKPIKDNVPDKPIIEGPASGKPLREYTYMAVTSDLDGDNVSYFFDWGDDTNSGWTEFVPSENSVIRSHRWLFSGTYIIKVKAKDDYGLEGDWATFIATMPRNKAITSSLFYRFLERYPLLNLLLQRLRI